METKIKIGIEVEYNDGDDFASGKIVDFGEKKGQPVADLDNGCWVYLADCWLKGDYSYRRLEDWKPYAP